ncbi:F-box domain, Skp2-like protein [Cordyceps fumosorosea ARSEF 2679]|uniref:F-box domain, Skp2-like protein n=1 Tax=Cordyceps fumosorosea (strain ARSEF 2679) TaxID=1081104 RepID=A0A167XCW9_CORFA|nr:F-box domain, Skp2-like protein [Cordyceps fumosorosea ARSEF 2679]OAA64821.1 F-box domain, Skp2-like protein [Cordyceps fumosorosea ARSEF 2679]
MAQDAANAFPLLLSRGDSALQLYPAYAAAIANESASANDDSAGDQNYESTANDDSARDQSDWDLDLQALQLWWQDNMTAYQQPADRLANLPMGIMSVIAEYLPRCNLVTLSLTCRRLRRLIYGQLERNISDVLTRHEYLEFLHEISHNNADEWVCKECYAIHEVNLYDTPESPHQVNCPIALYGDARTGPNGEVQTIEPWLGTTGVHLMEYHLGYHHVQHILKYHRLSSLTESQKGHLRRLMAPHERFNAFREAGHSDDTSKHEVHLRVFQQDILALSLRSRRLNSRHMTVDDMNGVYICPHLQVTFGFPGCQLEGPIHWPRLPYPARTENERSPLVLSLGAALALPGMSLAGSCSSCPIDYTVECEDSQSAEIRAWYRLGGECVGGEDRYWRALSVDMRGNAPDHSQFSAPTDPGTVRLLYTSYNLYMWQRLIEDSAASYKARFGSYPLP